MCVAGFLLNETGVLNCLPRKGVFFCSLFLYSAGADDSEGGVFQSFCLLVWTVKLFPQEGVFSTPAVMSLLCCCAC